MGLRICNAALVVAGVKSADILANQMCVLYHVKHMEGHKRRIYGKVRIRLERKNGETNALLSSSWNMIVVEDSICTTFGWSNRFALYAVAHRRMQSM